MLFKRILSTVVLLVMLVMSMSPNVVYARERYAPKSARMLVSDGDIGFKLELGEDIRELENLNEGIVEAGLNFVYDVDFDNGEGWHYCTGVYSELNDSNYEYGLYHGIGDIIAEFGYENNLNSFSLDVIPAVRINDTDKEYLLDDSIFHVKAQNNMFDIPGIKVYANVISQNTGACELFVETTGSFEPGRYIIAYKRPINNDYIFSEICEIYTEEQTNKLSRHCALPDREDFENDILIFRIDSVSIDDTGYNASVKYSTFQNGTALKYIYGDYGSTIDIENKLDKINNEKDAVNTLKSITDYMDGDEKKNSENIDLLTKLKEEIVSKISSVDAGKDVVINDALIESSTKKAEALESKLESVLLGAGISEQRISEKNVTVKAGAGNEISVKKELLNADVDNVKVITDFASLTVNKENANNISMKNMGSNKISVSFDTENTTSVKVSFPGLDQDAEYYAILDENGNPVGGKYNPATGEIEAKISASGEYSLKYNEKDFDDIQDKAEEVQKAIKALASKGVISGTSETTFSPDDSVSRAEIAALVIRTLSKLDSNADGGFKDVTRSNWYFGVAGSSKKYGIINGFEDNTFRGDAVIAKDQIVAVTARVLKNEMRYKVPTNLSEYLPYADLSSIPEWAKEDIAVANMANLVMRRTDNLFVANDEMTRGDAAIILYRLFNKIW